MNNTTKLLYIIIVSELLEHNFLETDTERGRQREGYREKERQRE